MGDRRCCCECYSYVDYFTEPHDDLYGPCRTVANGLTLGSKWEIISPVPPPDTWYVVSEGGYCDLYEEGNAGATILFTDRLTRGPENSDTGTYSRWMYAGIKVMYPQVGDVYSVLLDWYWICKSTGRMNYLEFRWTMLTASTSKLQLYSYVDGVETLLKECLFNITDVQRDFVMLSACVSKGWFWGYSSDGMILTEASGSATVDPTCPDTPDTGYRAALKHGNSHDVFFRNWFLYQLIDDYTYCPSCGWCFCQEGKNLPGTLNLTYIGYNEGCNDCTSLSGFTVPLKANDACIPTYWSHIRTYGGGCFGPWTDPLTGSSMQMIWFLYCPTHDPEDLSNWILSIAIREVPPSGAPGLPSIGGCASGGFIGGGDTYNGIRADPDQSTCDPFKLVFEVNAYGCTPEPHVLCPDPIASPGSCPDDPPPPDPPDYHAYVSYTNCPDSSCEQCGKNWPLNIWHRRHYKIIITE